MRMIRDVVAFLTGWFAALLLLFASPALAVPANTILQTVPVNSPVHSGVGAPRDYGPFTVATSGQTSLTDGTNPVLIPWEGVVQIDCPSLVGTTNVVLACFSMHIDAVVDQSDGQISHGSVDAEGSCMWLTGSRPTDDMRLSKMRMIQNEQQYPGAQFVGACDRTGTAYHLAPCSVADESTDCGAASTCDTGLWRSTSTAGHGAGVKSIDMIAGSWVRLDGTASTACYARVDI